MKNGQTGEKIKLIIAMCIFGTIGIFVKNIPLSSSIIAFVRGFVGMLFLCGVMLLRKKPVSPEAIKQNGGWLAVSGAFIGVNWILLFESYRYTSVATSTLCYYMAPVIVILLSPVLLKEKLTVRKIFCTVLALIGMVFVSGVWQQGIPEIKELKGILFGLGAALLYACIMLMNKKITDISSYDKTIVQLGISAVVLLPYCLLTEDIGALEFSSTTLLLLLLLGVLHTGVAYYLYFGAMGKLPAQSVAISSYIDPVVAVLVSVFVLREGMDIGGVIGAVLILGAAFVSELETTDL